MMVPYFVTEAHHPASLMWLLPWADRARTQRNRLLAEQEWKVYLVVSFHDGRPCLMDLVPKLPARSQLGLQNAVACGALCVPARLNGRLSTKFLQWLCSALSVVEVVLH